VDESFNVGLDLKAGIWKMGARTDTKSSFFCCFSFGFSGNTERQLRAERTVVAFADKNVGGGVISGERLLDGGALKLMEGRALTMEPC
jgi:hypothetical protein